MQLLRRPFHPPFSTCTSNIHTYLNVCGAMLDGFSPLLSSRPPSPPRSSAFFSLSLLLLPPASLSVSPFLLVPPKLIRLSPRLWAASCSRGLDPQRQRNAGGYSDGRLKMNRIHTHTHTLTHTDTHTCARTHSGEKKIKSTQRWD